MLIVFLRLETSCDLHSGVVDDRLSQTACHLQRRHVGDVTTALEALICSRALGVLSRALGEARQEEQRPVPSS